MMQQNHSLLDEVVLVNSNDEVLGSMDKIEAHRGGAHLHRAISVYLFRKNDDQVELLIQQRSAKKIVGAHQWANTVCGNVWPGESYEECAHRRLREELGIENLLSPRERMSSEANAEPDKSGQKSELILKPIYKFEYHLQCNAEFSEWEMDQVFVGWYDGAVKPNPEEAQDYEWVNWEELRGKEKETELLTENFKTKIIEIKNQQLTLAPWFVWMLGDEELVGKLKIFIKNY